MKQKLTGILVCCCLLSACSVHPVVPPAPPSDDATIKLTQAANSISESLIELSKIQAVATPPNPARELSDPATFGISGVASIDWTGPIGPLVHHLAAASHYRIRVLGTPPAIPIVIVVSAKDEPLADIIQDIDFQAEARADIVVYPDTRVIELRYAHM